MTAIASFPSTCLVLLTLGVLSIACGCKDQEVPRTQSGEPIPFDHMTSQPGDRPVIPAAAGQGLRTATAANQAIRSIRVSVKLSPALASKAAPGDTLFIFARAAQGPKMPLAIVRKQVKDLPITVTLDDSMAMVPDMNMSSFPQLVIGARVSKSGDAISKSGDLEGYTPTLKTGAAGPVEVVISSVVGNPAPSLPDNRPVDAAHDTGFKHPKSALKTRLNIPADVQAKWKAVELSVSGKDITVRTLRLAVGGESGIDKSGLTVRVVAYVPAFQSDAGVVTSASNSPDNPAVLIQLANKGKIVSEGWVFQKYPDFNTYKSEQLHLQLLSASGGTGG